MGLFNKKDNTEGRFAFSDDDKKVITSTVNPADKNASREQNRPRHVLTPEEILNSDEQQNTGGNALEMLKQRMGITDSVQSEVRVEPEKKAVVEENDSPSLLEKLKPYTVDDEGRDLAIDDQPIYSLKSVADILKNDETKIVDSLAEKYDISFEDLRKPAEKPAPKKAEPTVSKARAQKTDAFVKMVSDSIEKGLTLEEAEASRPKMPIPDISDIDNLVSKKSEQTAEQEDSATIMFTPVKSAEKNTSRISVSSITNNIDLGTALSEDISKEEPPEETELQQSDFEAFVPKEEFTPDKNGRSLIKTLAIKKRSAFIKTVLSALVMLVMLVFFIPALNDMLIKAPRNCMIVITSLFGLSALINWDITLSVNGLFTKNCTADMPTLLATVSALLLGVVSIVNSVSVFEVMLLAALILFARALCGFLAKSAEYNSLRQIAVSKPKKAVALLSDTATTMAMAKNAVEGDVLIAAPRPAAFIDGFMKYSRFSPKLSGYISTLSLVSLAVAVVSGVAVATRGGAVEGIQFGCEILCIAAMPLLFLVDSLPLFSAAKKLGRKGAMIAGLGGALHLENANAAVISSADIFPTGTVTLRSIKPLSENSIDDTIMKAASLTQSVNSPLFPIFQKIAGTGDGYSVPASDTVKYEDRLGLSGWVDNELLFIGNRTLLEAHGIAVPSLEVDKSILKRGCFPVYLATSEKACALIAVQYDAAPEVVKELRKLTSLGITLLVDNCDPNINEEMICDYIGLHEGFVKLMSKSAVHLYKAAVRPAERHLAPAAFRSGGLTFISVLNCASAIKKSNLLLSLCYILLSVAGAVMFIYYSFAGSGDIISGQTVLLYELAAAAAAYILYLFKKP